ncbi:MAG: hypothetical protein OXF23_06905, partial [Candidatus Dadabacteria bacterium]|nr:hypothetical protein [Candidatus Dadabacteria bacterium]
MIKVDHRPLVFLELTKLCDLGRLVFPQEVVDELKNGIKSGKPDAPLIWAKQNKKSGCRLGACAVGTFGWDNGQVED